MEAIVLNASDQVRFRNLMEQTYKKVFNLAYRLAGNRADAEDLTQEAFYRAYRAFRDFEGDRPFENWIFRIVNRLFLDLMRTRGRRVQTVSYDAPVRTDRGEDLYSVEAADHTPSPEQQMLQDTMSEELEAALLKLKPEQRLLVLLADVEGMPYNEIALVVGVPVGTVRSRLHRAHKALRQHLNMAKAKGTGRPTSFCLA
jgi:RNA polymerase sigma-70 factor (ECF subfamily)